MKLAPFAMLQLCAGMVPAGRAGTHKAVAVPWRTTAQVEVEVFNRFTLTLNRRPIL
jgi:hypothetical protein